MTFRLKPLLRMSLIVPALCLLLTGCAGKPESHQGVAVMSPDGARQEILITAERGYNPDIIIAKPNVPLRLTFHRIEEGICTETLLIPALGIERELPKGEKTVVDIPPQKAGDLDFSCGMKMWKGVIRFQETPPTAPDAKP
jgi:plastocyanin domain-containing protein